MATVNEVVSRLQGSAVWREAEAEAEAELVEKRREAAARIEEAEGAFGKQRPALEKALAKARARRDKLAAELDEATAAVGAAERALADASAMVATIREREHAYLRRTAPAAIAAFRRELEAEFERHRDDRTETVGGGYSEILSRTRPPERWNLPSKERWAAAVREGIAACERDLPLVPDPADLEKRIEKIREGIPDPHEMVPFDREEAA